MKTAVASWTTRAMDDLIDQIDATGAAGYEGIELAESVENVAAVRDALDSNGLELVALPIDADADGDRIDSVAETAAQLDCDRVRISYRPPEDFESPAAVEETAAELDGLAETFAGRGIDLLYHNHSHEFVDCGDVTAYDRLLEETSTVEFEIDVGWARMGGVDPVALLERYGDRAGTVHVTDIAAGPVTHDTDTERGVRLGEGVVDLQACVAAASEHGVEWACFEGWEPDDSRAWIEHAREVLGKLIAGARA